MDFWSEWRPRPFLEIFKMFQNFSQNKHFGFSISFDEELPFAIGMLEVRLADGDYAFSFCTKTGLILDNYVVNITHFI